MRVLRSLLILALLVGLSASATVAAAAPRAKTKIVFVNVPDEGYYSEFWWFGTTWTKDPVAKARLLRYRTSTKSWVGYGGRRITIKRGTRTIATRRTSRKGYFRFRMRYPGTYTAKFPGNAHARASKKTQERADWVQVRASTVATATPVDETRTRIGVQVTYYYNPYVTHDPPELITWITAWDLSAPSAKVIHERTTLDPTRPPTGFARTHFSVVVPTAAIENRYVEVSNLIMYDGYYYTEDDSDDEDLWFGTPVTFVSAETD